MDIPTNYGENVAAISAIIHQNPETYEEVYESIADIVGGFAGIWDYCAEVAKIFTEEEWLYIAGVDYYRIEAIEDYADKLLWYLQVGEIPTSEHLHNLAAWAIEKCFIENE